jgi:hypothetical protein
MDHFFRRDFDQFLSVAIKRSTTIWLMESCAALNGLNSGTQPAAATATR